MSTPSPLISIRNPLHDATAENPSLERPPVALVCMPWGSIENPSLAMAILKRCVHSAGFSPESHLLNFRFAEMLGLTLYRGFSEVACDPEWFFSAALFGAPGLGEIRNSWDDLKLDRAADGMVAKLRRIAGDSEELCVRIATEYVPRFMDECMSGIDWSKYLAVGFTSTFAQSLSSLLLARRIKESYPHVRVIFGGANVDSEMGVEIMKGCEWLDYVVHGEAETVFPMLLNNIASGRPEADLPGVSRRLGQNVIPGHKTVQALLDLNQSPTPDYSDYIEELERYGFKNYFDLRLFFESSRGCWWGAKHHCTFCGLNGTTMAFRRKDPDRVYEEVLELSRNYRCLTFSATDNILSLDYFAQLLPKFAALKTDIQFFYEIKANLTRDQVRLLSAAGMTQIQPGIESLNSKILKLMRKGVTAIQNIQLLKWCLEDGIEPFWNILYGFPGESAEDYDGYAEICCLLTHLRPPAAVSPVIFERFSPYFFDRERFGLDLVPSREYKFIFPGSRMDFAKVAYFFEGRSETQAADSKEYIQPTRIAVAAWRKVWEEQKVHCYYSKGPNYIVIHDNRPKAPDAPLLSRRIVLNHQVSEIYLFCDENRSFQAIAEMMQQKFGGRISADQVLDWLERLVAQGLMFRESNRYLSLAVHKKPSRAPAGMDTPEPKPA